LITELGFERAEIEFVQPKRKRGRSHNNFYTLYDMAMLGFVNHSKVPLRMATFVGFISSIISLMVAVIYFSYKILFWSRFQLGVAPVLIGLFFFTSVQLLFVGIIGEYVGAIYTQVKKRPLVLEKERVNFEAEGFKGN
jgi:glycosyltransferase involved in cell wall biosynthesis